MRGVKTLNKCCFKDKNQITIIDGWSYICKVCGRYTHDYENNQHIITKAVIIAKMLDREDIKKTKKKRK